MSDRIERKPMHAPGPNHSSPSPSIGIRSTQASIMETTMKGRIYRLHEYLQSVEQRLLLEEQRRDPNLWILLHLRATRLRIRNALRRTMGGWINPHGAMHARNILSLLPA
jgi:hypothetical protein